MTAEVRLRIRRARSERAHARIKERHVEFCATCGIAYDYRGRSIVPICRPCANSWRRKLVAA